MKYKKIKTTITASIIPLIGTSVVVNDAQSQLIQDNNQTDKIISIDEVIIPEYRNIGTFAFVPDENQIIYTLNALSESWTTKNNWYGNQIIITNINDASAVVVPIDGSQIYNGSVTLTFAVDLNRNKLDLDKMVLNRTLYNESNTVWKTVPMESAEILKRFWVVNDTMNKNDGSNLYIDTINEIDELNYQAILKAKPESYRYKGQTSLDFSLSYNANTGVDIYPETGYITNNDEGILEFTDSGVYTIDADDVEPANRTINIDDGADVTLKISGSMQVKPESGNSGIQVQPSGSLTIMLENNAQINIAATGAPAISAPEGASIILRGGGDIVVESDGIGCAVIGGPPYTNSGDIEILDNINVSATLKGDRNQGVAIGAGIGSVCNRVYINTTGTVIADNQSTTTTMTFFGAAIGGGGSSGENQPSGTVKEITIDNGQIYAYGPIVSNTDGSSGAVIGSGAVRTSTGTPLKDFGTITINGGFVYTEERSLGNANHRDGVAIGAGGAQKIGGTWTGNNCNGTFNLNGGVVVTKSKNNSYAADIGFPAVADWSGVSINITGGNVIRSLDSSAAATFSEQPQNNSTSLYPVYAKIDQTGTSGSFQINEKTFQLTDKIDTYVSNCSACFYLPVGTYTTSIDGISYSINVTANNYTFAQAQTNSSNILIPQ